MGVLLSGRVYAADLCVELDGDVLTNVWRSVSVFVVPKPVAVLLAAAPPGVPRCPLPWPANARGIAINDTAINNAKNRNLTI